VTTRYLIIRKKITFLRLFSQTSPCKDVTVLEGGGQKGRISWAREGKEKGLKEKYLARCSRV